jgi:hypothetical protein
MRTIALGVALTAAGLALLGTVRSDLPTPATPQTVAALPHPIGTVPAVPPATLTQVVQFYCVTCHNDGMLTGNVSLQAFTVEGAADRAETAERMIRKLRAGMMPPPGAPRPGGDTLTALVETLEATVDAAARTAPVLGERRFQRLSRTEYEYAVRDLLALDVEAENWLPTDVLVGAFDNGSAGQVLSTTLLDSFLRAASDVSRMAVGNAGAASSTKKWVAPLELSQHAWERLEGAPFGTRGGMVVTHHFPADGEYVFQVGTALGTGNQTSMEDIDISIDGEPVALLMLENNGGSSVIETEPIFVRAGQHTVSAAFVDIIDGPYEDRFKPPAWSYAGSEAGRFGITGLTHLAELLITGPKNVTGVSETESRRKIFTCRPASRAEERPCAQRILTGLATQAFRRPVAADDVAGLMGLYDEAAATEGFEVGVRTGIEAILAMPEFVFRLEREPASLQPSESYRLSDIDLATRLSFFLWDAAPDEELLEVAASGRLSEPRVLEEQARRMLADPRSATLASRFAHQWLRLQDVGKVWPEGSLYPDFSSQLAELLVQETELLFQHLVREDRSLLELFSADYTFLNARLAQHYGIPGVSGEEMRLVRYPNDQRRGILGHGSILHLTSMSDRTSPVLRGKWVMEVLMGTPPPPPPPNVPAFEASSSTGAGRRLTTRERMEQHRAAPLCNSCHRFMDPIGLALDNFDAVGQWRIRENMAPLDTRGVFYDGTPITRPAELVGVLLKRPTPLVRNFTQNLLAYSMGRPVEYFDQPTVRSIAKASEADGYKLSSLIMGVIKSDAFQMRRAQSTAN